MIYLTVLNIISGILVFSFGLYVLFLNYKDNLNQIFFVLSLFVSFFSFIYYNFYLSYDKNIAKFWYKFLLVWPFIVSLSFHLILAFVKNRIKLFWTIVLHFIAFCFTINQIYIYKHFIQFKKINDIWIYYVIPHISIANILFIIWATILQILSLYYLFRHYINIKSKKFKKITLVIIFGILIPFVYGFIKGIFQGFGGFYIIDLNIPFYAISTIIFGYGIVKYDLFKRTLKDKLIESFDSSNILFVIVKNNKINFINNYTRKLLKIENKNINSLNILDFIERENFKTIYHKIITISNNYNSKLIEIKVFDIEKNEHFFIFNITRLFDEVNETYYYILIGNDITYQKKIEEELKKAKELAEISDISKQNFIHNLHHELKTPLTSIIGFSDFLISKISNDEFRKELEIINNSGKVLYEYFQNLIEVTNLDFKEIKNDIFDINNLIKHIENTYLFLAKTKKIDFKIETKGHMNKLLIGDFIKTKQIISMILNNSFKFVSDNPKIKLLIEEVDKNEFYGNSIFNDNKVSDIYENGKDSFSENSFKKIFNEEDYINSFNNFENFYFYRFIIDDNGIGIDSKKIDKIGQIFELGENVLNKNFRGIGLGLFITNKLIQMLKGKFFIKSKLGVGTEVEVILPFKKSLK